MIMAGIGSMVSTAMSAIGRELGRTGIDDCEEGEFRMESLYRRTISTFSPRTDTGRKRSRGRPTSIVQVKMFLLSKPDLSVPSTSMQKKLTKSGLGFPKLSNQGQFCVLRKTWTIHELEHYILSLYPGVPLDLTGFYLGKSLKNKKIKRIEFSSVVELKKELFRGKLYIVPRSEISFPVTPSISRDSQSPETLAALEENQTPGVDDQNEEVLPQTVETPVRHQEDLPRIRKPKRPRRPQLTRENNKKCPDCHRTLSELQCLHCIQDREYQESLRIDQQRNVEQIQFQEGLQRLKQLKDSRKRSLPDEPQQGIKLKFRSSSEVTFSRTFAQHDSVEVLMNFVGSYETATEYFQIFIPNRQPLLSDYKQGTLLDLGLTKSTVVQVKWLTEDEFQELKLTRSEDELIQAEDELIQVEDEHIDVLPQPSENFSADRPQRKAAVECNYRMKFWLNASTASVDSLSNSDLPSPETEYTSIPASTSTSNEFNNQGGVSTDTYRNYVEVVCISDSGSDSDVEITHQPKYQDCSEEEMIVTLTRLSCLVKKNKITRLNIHRPSIWECTIRKFKKEDFTPENDLLVKFSDDFGSTEEGIDQGGPKREYLALIMEHVLDSYLFEGPVHARTLSWNKSAHDKEHYRVAGMIIALSLVHGGPAPHCIAPALVKALEMGPRNVVVSIEDMPDLGLKEQLLEILNATDTATRTSSIEKVSTFLDYSGIVYYNCKTEEEARELVNKAVQAYLFDRTNQAFEQFRTGLKILNVMDNFSSLKSLFLYKNTQICREQFENLFSYDVEEKGSNAWQQQTATIAMWRDYLEDVEDGKANVTFSQILQFCTGSKTVPPLGFSPNPTIAFWTERFPKGVTCTNTLVLPYGKFSFEKFVTDFEFGILNTQGFLLQ